MYHCNPLDMFLFTFHFRRPNQLLGAASLLRPGGRCSPDFPGAGALAPFGRSLGLLPRTLRPPPRYLFIYLIYLFIYLSPLV